MMDVEFWTLEAYTGRLAAQVILGLVQRSVAAWPVLRSSVDYDKLHKHKHHKQCLIIIIVIIIIIIIITSSGVSVCAALDIAYYTVCTYGRVSASDRRWPSSVDLSSFSSEFSLI